MEGFDRFQLAGLALICLKNETKADAERDLRDLISAAGADVREKAHRERLLRHLEAADKAHPLELAKYSLKRAGASAAEIRFFDSPQRLSGGCSVEMFLSFWT